MQNGQLATVVVDSLSAFFPGVQTLMGDLESAIKSHAVYAFQWKRYGGLPETFDINQRRGVHLGGLLSFLPLDAGDTSFADSGFLLSPLR